MTVVQNIDEKVLLQKLRDGDHAAFEEIYDSHKRQLAANMLRLVKSEELAEDLLQDLFVKLWSNRQSIDVDKPIAAYMYRMARNMVIDTFRRSARDKKLESQLTATMDELYSHVEEQLLQKENAAMLWNVIDMLPPQRKQVFTLCKIEGLSYKEVSAKLGISVDAVNDHIKKANKLLREQIKTNDALLLGIAVGMLLKGF